MNLQSPLITSLKRKSQVLIQFMTAQGLTLFGNLAYGLLCVRLLSTSDYAQFVVLFGVQGTLIVLMDINFSGTLIPLVGERVHDAQLIADYVASLRDLAVRVYVVAAVGLAIAFPLLVKNRGWSWHVIVAMVVILLTSTWFIRVASAYGAVLIMYRDRQKWYTAQVAASLGALALLVLMWALHSLNAFTAILLNVAQIIGPAIFYYFRAQKLLGLRGNASRQKKQAIVRLALPNIPQAIFYALQGQICLLLITFFGRTAGIASVGALARLGQVFTLFMQMNPILVEPYFAKLAKERLKSSYFAALGIAAFICISATVVAVKRPEIFLWVLGPQYSGLRYEVVLSIAAGAVSCFSGVLWTIHSSRRFVYWWSNITSIVLILVVQILFIVHADLTSVDAVLMLNLVTNIASLSVNVMCGFYGFFRGPRAIDAETDGMPLQHTPGDTTVGNTLEEAEYAELQSHNP